jgi:AraC family transcriptional regulator of adaptative response / DNA-3-methyladenine glycosylase II
MLHPDICERARLARDPRFDGQFFIGVTTTGIYCRPICPAVSPKRAHVRYFPSAAAAAEAGFRPCLRCRPECAPGTPAWNGTSTTVRRGLRLIAAGALDHGSVEELAERLGVTSRHLRRLFLRHLGASPLAVASTQRLHFAKRLIDETRLPMSHVAVAAGYGSVRRFNDAFLKTYGRAPRELRRANGSLEESAEGAPLTLRLHYREPLDWPALLEFLNPRATPGVESVTGDTYRRVLSIDGRHGVVEVAPANRPGVLALTLYGMGTEHLFELVRRAREVFDLDAPAADIVAVLARDPVLRPRLQRRPGVRVPGAWNGFELTVRAILGQQVSVRAATTLAGRLAARYGEPLAAAPGIPAGTGLTHAFPSPERLCRARLQGLGLTESRAATIRRVAAAVCAGDLRFDADDPDELCRALRAIRGIGEWTVQYVAMRALRHPDAWPATDLGLLKALEPPHRMRPAELAARAESWRPWRAYAAMLLWSSLAGTGG